MKKTIPSIIALLLLGVAAFTYYNKGNIVDNAAQKFGAALSIGTADNPQARADWEKRRLADPTTGEIPTDMRLRELAFAKKLRQQQNSRSQSSIDSLQWLMRGPYNMGGRTRAFAVDIADPNIMLAGGVSGGMWRSVDAGATWSKVSTINEHQGITCLVQDTRPSHTNTWYYGTGEGYGNSASGNGAYYLGDGMYKSVDNGLTWQVLDATDNGVPNSFTTAYQMIWNMAIDPSNLTEEEVYATAYGVIYRSTNGGTSWQTELGNLNTGGYVNNIAVSQTGVVYATISSDGSQGGIWRSTDGQTWNRIEPTNFPDTFDRMAIGINPSNENEVYFLVATTPNAGKTTYNFQDEPENNSLWRYNYLSGNGSGAGGQWTDLSENLPIGPYPFDDFVAQGGYDLLVTVKPNDPNTVFIGGTNIYRSTDGFTTPNNTTFMGGYNETTQLPIFTLYPTHHPDQHVLFFDPQNPEIMYSGNDGGLYKTNNCMANEVVWQSLNHGYVTTQFYSVAVDQSVSNNVIIGGLQDNGTRYVKTANTSDTWTMPFNYDGSYCAIPSNRDYMFMSINGGSIVKVQVDDNGEMAAFERVDPVGATDFQFINPFIMDPVNNDVLYVSEGPNLWVNTDISVIDIANGWEKRPENWFKNANHIADTAQYISALGASNTPAYRLYLGTSSKRVYRIDNSLDSNSPMVDITPTTGFPTAGYVSCVEVDPRDANKVFVVFSNYGVYSLFYSVDAGATWQKVAGNLEQFDTGSGNGPSLRSISILPITADSTAYFVGTSVGLYYTSVIDTLDTEWIPVALSTIGTTVVEMVETRALDKLIVAGTHGNGVFTANTPADPAIGIAPNTTTNNNLMVYPNPAVSQITISCTALANTTANLMLYNTAGSLVHSQTVSQGNAVVSVAHLPAGVYYVQLSDGKRSFTQKVVKLDN